MSKLSAICSIQAGSKDTWDKFRQRWYCYINFIFPLIKQLRHTDDLIICVQTQLMYNCYTLQIINKYIYLKARKASQEDLILEAVEDNH